MTQISCQNLIRGVGVYSYVEELDRWSSTASFGGLSPAALSQQGGDVVESVIKRAARDGFPVIETLNGVSSPSEIYAVVALPCMDGERCTGVAVFDCAAVDGARGAFEVWRPNERGELALGAAWHPNLERLGRISRYIKFPIKAGLPGMVWEDRFPRVLGSLENSKQFVRVSAARTDSLSTAVGVPWMRKYSVPDAVLVVLSSQDTPLARAFEVWGPEAQPEADNAGEAEAKAMTLKIVSADYGDSPELAAVSRGASLPVGQGIAGRSFRSRAPWVTSELATIEPQRGALLSLCGIQAGLGFPVIVGERVVASVVMYF